MRTSRPAKEGAVGVHFQHCRCCFHAHWRCHVTLLRCCCLLLPPLNLQELWPGYHKHAPTPAHHFMRLLHDKGLLHTVFTQNIDGLEQIAGLPAEKVVNAHGSFDGEGAGVKGLG